MAQLAMIREELVEKHGWISGDKFKKSVAIYQLLPGPEAHEMCVHIGTMKGGRIGGLIAGLAFMTPGFLLMLAFANLYQHFGKERLFPLFLFTTPIITALIVRAVHRLGSHAITGYRSFVPLIGSIILTSLNIHFTIVFVIAALWETLWIKRKKKLAIGLCIGLATIAIFAQQNFFAQKHFEFFPNKSASTSIFLTGLKGGMLSFGGAYTAIPVVHDDMVDKYPSISHETFLDSLAIGSIIPSPLVIFATFLGYIAGGLPSAILITIGIFLPAFLFSMTGFELMEKLVENKTLHSILEGISVAVIGLLVVTAFHIFVNTINTNASVIAFALGLALFYKVKKNWIAPVAIIGAALLGALV